MKRTIIAAMSMLATMAGMAQPTGSFQPAIPKDAAIEKRVQEIVSKMSLDDKIGQMCEININNILYDGKLEVDPAKLKAAIENYRVGSFLNAPFTNAVSPEEWYRIISPIQKESMSVLGIPDIYGVDQNHGSTYSSGGTLFPQEINMAATFNRDLVREGARITAYEARACDIPWVYNPVMDLARNSAWSRIWESFGEDPFINGAMAVEMVKGYQGDNPNHIGQSGVAACLKHYMAYGATQSGKDRTPAYVSLADLRDKYFTPYKMAIEAGALSIMVNSASINGMPVHASYELLTEWLKEDLEWDGMIVTDWADIHNLWKREKVAADYKEAIEIAINAGIDMSMTPDDYDFCPLLKELVQEGRVPQSRIDDAVARIIRIKLRLGLFETPDTKYTDYPLYGSKDFAAKALEAAVQSEILLKNEDNILPIPKGKRILVTGPNANSIRPLNGGWSYTWQGSDDGRYTEPYNTIYEAFCNEYGASNVILETGMDYVQDYGRWQELKDIRIDKAVAAVQNADIIVACVGENSYCETPGNIDDLTLSASQTELVKALAATGKPVVLVLNQGRCRIVREIEPLCKAVIDIILPGNYGGDALALLTAGKRNFSAKLPITYPKWANGLATYDHKPSEIVPTMAGAYNYSADIDIQWPFGYGMSYTTYEYSDLTVDKTRFTASDVLTVSVKVTNTGNVEGMEPVILYSSDLVAMTTPDVLRVRGFDKVSLKAGESRTVSFRIPASDLAFVRPDGKWTLEKGDFSFSIGDCKANAACTATHVWDTPNI